MLGGAYVPKLEKLFRSRLFWLSGFIIFLFVSFLLAGPWMTEMMPIVLLWAPGMFLWGLGIVDAENVGRESPGYLVFLLFYHLMFGGVYVYLLIRLKKLDRPMLYTLGFFVLFVLSVTLKGCVHLVTTLSALR